MLLLVQVSSLGVADGPMPDPARKQVASVLKDQDVINVALDVRD